MSSIKPSSQLNADQSAVVADVNKLNTIAASAGGSKLTGSQATAARAAEIDMVSHIPGSYQHGIDEQHFAALADSENSVFSAASGTGTNLAQQVSDFAKTANAAFDQADGAGSAFVPETASAKGSLDAISQDMMDADARNNKANKQSRDIQSEVNSVIKSTSETEIAALGKLKDL